MQARAYILIIESVEQPRHGLTAIIDDVTGCVLPRAPVAQRFEVLHNGYMVAEMRFTACPSDLPA